MPSSSFAVGAVPGLDDTLLVLEARRRRRRLRLLARIAGWGAVLGLLGVLVVALPQRALAPPCARAQAVAWNALAKAAHRQRERRKHGPPAMTTAALWLHDDAKRGIHYALTDVDETGSVLWAFIDAGDGHRGAIVAHEEHAIVTVVDACGPVRGGIGGALFF